MRKAALRLFAERGYAQTTVEMIAAQAGTTGRTFFRYFDCKAAVVWHDFDAEVAAIAERLDAMPASMSVLTSIRQAVLAVNDDRTDLAGLRARTQLIAANPEVAASGAVHYAAWEHAVARFVSVRTRVPADSLHPLTVGRTTLAACRTATERWAAQGGNLLAYLDAALRALGAGLADAAIRAEPEALRTRTAPIDRQAR